MNRLALVSELHRECSVAGAGVATTIDQRDEIGRLVGWIDQAYEQTQSKYFDWRFLRSSGTFTTQANTNIIQAPADLNIWDRERLFDSSLALQLMTSFDEYKDGINVTNIGKPSEFLINADNTLTALPYPDDAYTYTFSYFKKPDVMTADASVPLIPEQFQRVIIGLAMTMYGNYEAAPEIAAQGAQMYQQYMSGLVASQAAGERHHYHMADSHIQIKVV